MSKESSFKCERQLILRSYNRTATSSHRWRNFRVVKEYIKNFVVYKGYEFNANLRMNHATYLLYIKMRNFVEESIINISRQLQS